MSAGCSIDTPPISESCADPAYRAAHPEECANFTLLVLTPDQGLIQSGGTIEYTVLLRANGKETPITKGLTWTSSNVGAAIINSEGVATGVSAGQTTISVTWQNLSAQAQLDVVASCSETNQNFRIVIDNSPSMGQSFSSSYSTKLAFSKSIARDFCDTINFSKDQVAVSSFTDDYNELQAWSESATAPKSAISGISLDADGKTNLAGALSEAVNGFSGKSGVRVIVLFTDGQWTSEDPKPIAQAFRESGGFLVIVATRAFNNSGSTTEGKWFSDLFSMASGGFLLSAYGATEDDILQSLSGLKSFICSGGCTPDAGTAPTAKLNYTGFINWDVTREDEDENVTILDSVEPGVDLVGLGLWDLLPGNGLYVDMRGSIFYSGQQFESAQLRSKEDFTFTMGQDYKISIKAAGSNTIASGVFKIRVRCGDELDEVIQITDPAQDFATYEYEWTPTVTHTGKIIIEQFEHDGIHNHQNVGSLVDDISLENLTTADVLLLDTFDNENPVTIPAGSGYGYGCLEAAPGSQTADTSPPPFMEE